MVKETKILIIEDNPADIGLIREAFELAEMRCKLEVVHDGLAALAFLQQKEPYVSVSLPDFILLDLNLPQKSGLEVLQEVKSDAKLKHIPVAVLTSSDVQEDIAKSYDLHANCFITKPWDMQQYARIMRSLGEFWFRTAVLPKVPKAGS